MRKVLALLVVALSALFGVAWAQTEISFFGDVTIGKPLKIPACGNDYQYAARDTNCFRGFGTDGTLEFPPRQMPDYMQYGPQIHLDDTGVVTGMNIVTTGVVGQADAYAALEKKLGKPTTKLVRQVETVAGAQHASISAMWLMPGFKVTFTGTAGSATDGMIMVMTPEREAALLKKAQKQEM